MPADDERPRRRQSPVWRLLAPAVFLLAGALFIASAVSSGGTDLRAGRVASLGDLVESEADQLSALRSQQADLTDEIDDLTATLGDTNVREIQQVATDLEGPAGLEPVKGPGVTVTLDDAPDEIQDTAEVPIKDLVVHQQDIQAVANALWAGGAEAMTIQGQRVVSTTGIRCVGNTVVLHDVPYAPPYVISAIGPIDTMLTSIDDSRYIDAYLQIVESYQLGWEIGVDSEIEMPGFTGSTELNYARPVGESAGSPDDGT